jgi:hypothetical protein
MESLTHKVEHLWYNRVQLNFAVKLYVIFIEYFVISLEIYIFCFLHYYSVFSYFKLPSFQVCIQTEIIAVL